MFITVRGTDTRWYSRLFFSTEAQANVPYLLKYSKDFHDGNGVDELRLMEFSDGPKDSFSEDNNSLFR